MIKTKVTTVINRPLNEVFDYLTAGRNFPTWFAGVIKSARQTSAWPLGAGSAFEVAGQFLGSLRWSVVARSHHTPSALAAESGYRW